ncbi:ImuA family protein [Sandarakinorhabdus sp. DWP1-3-1]|uniref:ImuA family protein n=1 Tax=Sandarakinorhabdus sp. DWP1-3-1 TaxID=2804627 RepID=UPI003CEB6AE9
MTSFSSLAPALVAMATLAEPVPDAGLRFGFGCADVDARLGGGLAPAALHEVFAAREGDEPAAAGFALLLALRSARPGPVIWLREDKARINGRPYGLGLADLGLDPARLLLVQAPDTLAVLRAGADAVACAAVATVIIEPWGKATALDLTATRRLALGAARSGVTTLLLRTGDPPPSAASSRWQVATALSSALPANTPGMPAFDVTLLRHRGGIAGFSTRLEWDRDRRAFGTALPGVAPAVAAERARAPRVPAARRRAA